MEVLPLAREGITAGVTCGYLIPGEWYVNTADKRVEILNIIAQYI